MFFFNHQGSQIKEFFYNMFETKTFDLCRLEMLQSLFVSFSHDRKKGHRRHMKQADATHQSSA